MKCKIQELKSMLAEAEPDEVHLVLSSTAGAKSLIGTAERFADVGTTALLLTKLDEANSLGHLVSLVRAVPPAGELPDRRPERAGRHSSGRAAEVGGRCCWELKGRLRVAVAGVEAPPMRAACCRTAELADARPRSHPTNCHSCPTKPTNFASWFTAQPPPTCDAAPGPPMIVVAGGKAALGRRPWR